jgi:hypothetical protein
MRLSTIITVLLLTCALCLAESSTFKDPTHGFTITALPTWSTNPGANGSRVIFAAPKAAQGFQANVNVMVEKTGPISLADYTAASKKQLATVKATILSETPLKLGQNPAYELVWRANMQGKDLQFISTYTAKGDTVYVITSTSLQSNFKQNEPAFRTITKSFRI